MSVRDLYDNTGTRVTGTSLGIGQRSKIKTDQICSLHFCKNKSCTKSLLSFSVFYIIIVYNKFPTLELNLQNNLKSANDNCNKTYFGITLFIFITSVIIPFKIHHYILIFMLSSNLKHKIDSRTLVTTNNNYC